MNSSTYKNLIKKPLFLIGTVVFCFILGYVLRGATGSGIFPNSDKDTECVSNLEFINPQPGCELYELKLQKMSALEEALNVQTDEFIKEGKANRISIFTRDLKSQRFAGVHDTDIFIMASLLKVPLVMTYYRVSDTAPETMDQPIMYEGDLDLYDQQSVVPTDKLIKGNTYTYRDLARRALIYSDNIAAQILLGHISDGYFDKTLVALGLQAVRDGQKEDFVTAKSYAGVFRILYNSTFLSRTSSNEIIKILTESAFTDGATKKLPKDVVVAHKFGERTIVNPDNGVGEKKQLHDCGIVYAKNGKEPYTFCIMTEGDNFDELKTVIQDVSYKIYETLID